jgi:hypothetical protein
LGAANVPAVRHKTLITHPAENAPFDIVSTIQKRCRAPFKWAADFERYRGPSGLDVVWGQKLKKLYL